MTYYGSGFKSFKPFQCGIFIPAFRVPGLNRQGEKSELSIRDAVTMTTITTMAAKDASLLLTSLRMELQKILQPDCKPAVSNDAVARKWRGTFFNAIVKPIMEICLAAEVGQINIAKQNYYNGIILGTLPLPEKQC